MKRGFLGSLLLSFALYMLPAVALFSPTPIQARSYANMSCYNLWYARNAIFADQGYCFESARTVNTFGRRCYSPYGRLSAWQKEQISNIKYWERRRGCNGNGSVSRPTYTKNERRLARVSGIRWDDTLAVRSGPSTRYRRIGDLPPDAKRVQILRCSKSWCRIRYRGMTGWSYSKYLRSY